MKLQRFSHFIFAFLFVYNFGRAQNFAVESLIDPTSALSTSDFRTYYFPFNELEFEDVDFADDNKTFKIELSLGDSVLSEINGSYKKSTEEAGFRQGWAENIKRYNETIEKARKTKGFLRISKAEKVGDVPLKIEVASVEEFAKDLAFISIAEMESELRKKLKSKSELTEADIDATLADFKKQVEKELTPQIVEDLRRIQSDIGNAEWELQKYIDAQTKKAKEEEAPKKVLPKGDFY